MLYGLKDAADFAVTRKSDNKRVLWANYCQTSSISFTADSTFAHNKTVNAVRWDGNRQGTFNTTTEIFNLDWLALLFGSDLVSSDSLPFLEREELTVAAGGKITLAKVPLAAPKPAVYKVTEKDLTDLSNPVEDSKVAVTAASKEITLTGVDAGAKVVVIYTTSAKGQKFTVDNKHFPGSYAISGVSALRDTDNVDHPCQFEIMNAKPQSNVELSMDVNNVCQLNITWDILADANGNMYTMQMLDTTDGE